MGPYFGTLSTFLGGTVGFFLGFFSPPSLASGVVTAACSGLIHRGKWPHATSIYLTLFLLLALYPNIGPAWLFPQYIWFQTIGLLILLSPLQRIVTQKFHAKNNSGALYAFLVTSLVSTLAGQIAGTLTLALTQIPDENYFLGIWVTTALLYPVERIIIALGAAFTGVALHKTLNPSDLTRTMMTTRKSPHEKTLT